MESSKETLHTTRNCRTTIRVEPSRAKTDRQIAEKIGIPVPIQHSHDHGDHGEIL